MTRYLVRYSIFTWRKSTKGVPKRWKTNLHQIYSLKPRVIWHHKGSVAILFWDEKRLWLGNGGLKCENSVPKFERETHPDPWGGPIDPKLCKPTSYVQQSWSASKRSHSRTFAPLTSSGIMRCHKYGLFSRGVNIDGVRIWSFLTLVAHV
jgi:hypothetical protein